MTFTFHLTTPPSTSLQNIKMSSTKTYNMESLRRELNNIPTTTAPASMPVVVRQLATIYDIESIRRELDNIAATFVSAPISMPIRLRHVNITENQSKETQKAQKGSSEKAIPPVSSTSASLPVAKTAEESCSNKKVGTSSPPPASTPNPLYSVKKTEKPHINMAQSTKQDDLIKTSTAPKPIEPRRSIFDSTWADEISTSSEPKQTSNKPDDSIKTITAPKSIKPRSSIFDSTWAGETSPSPEPQKTSTKSRRRSSKAAKQQKQASPLQETPAQPRKAAAAPKATTPEPAPKVIDIVAPQVQPTDAIKIAPKIILTDASKPAPKITITAAPQTKTSDAIKPAPKITAATQIKPTVTNKYSIFASAYAN
ncbi:hypothetical protein D6C78_10657 [Aureobasidium pullulans]|uniref:Uncharacterized protein n=1 Tax=Aureobasidium pullulans TaxID=5580 RepID=A0A4T0BAA6_AURPU|nr:hypothetical protein D6C78_10657 [Aureobasidium pullulans]